MKPPNPTRYDVRLYSTALVSSIFRLQEVPGWGWITSAAAGLLALVCREALVGILVLQFLAGVADYWYGVRTAKLRGTYSPLVAHAGAVGKSAGIVLVFLVRGAEWWASAFGLVPDTRGWVAVTIAASLFLVDLQSIANHREELGARPIPVLSRLLELAQALLAKKLPDPGGRP